MPKKNFIDRLVYLITEKPKCYKKVKNPPKTDQEKLARPQEARQVQYNHWSKAHQRYSGSYLPYSGKELEKQGWTKIVDQGNQTPYNERYVRNSTKQEVLRHAAHTNKEGEKQRTHYHWRNPSSYDMPKREKINNYYLDEYGNPCRRKSAESHIKPNKTRRKK